MSDEQKQEPVAWAVMVRWEYRDICDTFAEARNRADAITYWDGDKQKTAAVQPLYRQPQPTLTRYERHCLTRVVDAYADEDDVAHNEIAAVLYGLLERTK